MSSAAAVDLFVEDRAHEEFFKAIVARPAREKGKKMRIVVRSARGGHPRVSQEFQAYLRLPNA